MNAYFLTLLANLSFSLGSQFFTHYSRKFSSTWMNTYKALVAAFCFGIVILLSGGFHLVELGVFSLFLLSGVIGLGLGDILLLKAYEKIGPGRTMLLFGFHPIVIGILAYFIFQQNLNINSFWAIVFFICCLGIFSFESFKKHGHWDLAGLLFAFGGMLLDAIGVLITRMAFEKTTELSAFEGNFYRCLGALLAYFVIQLFYPFQFKNRFRSLELRSKIYVFLGAFLGTFLSLALYLQAIKTTNNLAGISAIAITGVIFSSTFECIWERKKPTVYLFIAFIFFLFGMKFTLEL